jgi:tetratricopeptide (TPR) repeat protein
MAEEQIEQEVSSITEIKDVWHKTEDWFEVNKQKVAIGGAILAIVILAVVYIFAKWLPDRNLKAQRNMYMAEMMFAKDSFDMALNGNATFKGFLDVKNNYGFTKAANLCNYYIGVCYLHKKDYAKAIDFLGSYSSDEPILGAAKFNAMGDAAAEQNKADDATGYYKKAAGFSENEVFTPFYMLKLGMYYESQKKFKDAQEVYNKIKDKYPNTQEGRDIDKYIARAAAQG